MLKVFPEARKLVQTEVKRIKADLRRLEEEREHWIQFAYRKFPSDVPKRENAEWWLTTFLVEPERMRAEARLSVLESMLRWKENAAGEASLQKARTYPISDLIQFDRKGWTRCIFHDEKTPSMRYDRKKNRVWCFSCNKGWDAIDVFMRMGGGGFNDAIKSLSR